VSPLSPDTREAGNGGPLDSGRVKGIQVVHTAQLIDMRRGDWSAGALAAVIGERGD
jgi:hypothetical protein